MRVVICTLTLLLIAATTSFAQEQPMNKTTASLLEFLKTPIVNEKVAELAYVAQEKYSNPNHPLSRRRAEAKRNGAMMGGRQSGWIEETFDQDEASILKELAHQPPLRTWTVEEIETAFEAVRREHPPQADASPPVLTSVKGMGVNYLYDNPALVEGGFAQLASQYNYLESVGPFKMPVSRYLGDRTQGPQGCLEAAAASLHRAAAELAGLLPHALVDVVPKDHENYLNHGYLELAQLDNSVRKQALYEHIKKHISKLRVLAQPVVTEASDTRFYHVLAAAPSWQGYGRPADSSVDARIAELLVVSQYRAIAQLAVIRAATTGERVPVHLTLVGQGAYNNPRSVMNTAIREVARVVHGYPGVVVFIQSYSGHEPVRAAHSAELFQLRELDRLAFEALAP
jgi:hypothetical protein